MTLALKSNKKSSKTIQVVQASALTSATGRQPPPVIAEILVNWESYFHIPQFTGIETFALKLISVRWLDVHRLLFSEGGSLLSSLPWAHYENGRYTLRYIVLAISVQLLQGIKIPSSSGSHSTPACINLNFSEKKNCSQKHFPLTWDSTFSLRPTGKAMSSSAVQATPSNHNYKTTGYLG